MNLKLLFLFSIIFLTITLTACKSNKKTHLASYNTITTTKAKEMMDENSDIIILDVRTLEEYNEGHIDGALLIPDYQLLDKAETVLTNPSATILVYCRSGRRSAIAAKNLADLGYSNIYDFGGILDWEYDIVID
ncbi:MAG TPA: rhodanese-like domain-containing protein [Clostridiales bacterium]|nr:rhodanese-like domain-containing protein [Clostridiales bacterium]